MIIVIGKQRSETNSTQNMYVLPTPAIIVLSPSQWFKIKRFNPALNRTDSRNYRLHVAISGSRLIRYFLGAEPPIIPVLISRTSPSVTNVTLGLDFVLAVR